MSLLNEHIFPSSIQFILRFQKIRLHYEIFVIIFAQDALALDATRLKA